jgi:hypothetical protein
MDKTYREKLYRRQNQTGPNVSGQNISATKVSAAKRIGNWIYRLQSISQVKIIVHTV